MCFESLTHEHFDFFVLPLCTVLSLLLMSYDVGGATRLYDYFVQPLLRSREDQIEIVASRIYSNALQLWLVLNIRVTVISQIND